MARSCNLLSFFNSVSIVFYIFLISQSSTAPVNSNFNVSADSLYTHFINDITAMDCSIPNAVVMPFDSAQGGNSDYLSPYLTICQNSETTRPKERDIMCNQIFEILKNISCLYKEISLPVINVTLSKQVCTDFDSLKIDDSNKEKGILESLTSKFVCDIMCDAEFQKACQVLLWSFKVQQNISGVVASKMSTLPDPHAAEAVADGSKKKIELLYNLSDPQLQINEQKPNQKLDVSIPPAQEVGFPETHLQLNNEPMKSQTTSSKVTTIKSILTPDVHSKESSLSKNQTNTQAILQEPLVDEEEEQPHDRHSDQLNGDRVEEHGEYALSQLNTLNEAETAHDQPIHIDDSPNDLPINQPEKPLLDINPNPVKVDQKNNDITLPKTGKDKLVDQLEKQKPLKELHGSSTTRASSALTQQSSTSSQADQVTNPVKNEEIADDHKATKESQTELTTNQEAAVETTVSKDQIVSGLPKEDGAENNQPDEYELEKSGDDDDLPADHPDYDGIAYEKTDANTKPKETHAKAEDDFQTGNDFVQRQNDIQMIAAFPEQEDSHFFFYFLSIVLILMAGYLVFHNKQKIIALIVEGRHERRRRSHGAGYKKLETK